MFHRPALFLALSFGTALRAAPAGPGALLTAEELFRPASLGQASLSPDGQHLGAIVSQESDRRHLLIVDLKDYLPSGLRGQNDFEVSSFSWLGNDRVLFNIVRGKIYAWGLFTVKLDRLDRQYPINTFDATQIVGLPRLRPGRVLVWIVKSADQRGKPGPLVELDVDRAPSDLTLNNRNDAFVRSYPPPKDGTVVGWASNQDGELALCITWSAGRSHLHRYLHASATWREVPVDLSHTSPMWLDPDDRYLWIVTHSSNNGYELRRLDLDSEEVGAPVLTDPVYDIGCGRLYFTERTHELAGVSYMQRQSTTVWLAKDYAAVQAAIDGHYPGADNVLLERDRSERKFLFQLSGPQRPGAYVLLDLDRRSVQQLAEAAPWLKGRPLRPVQPISFRTRDGVKLEGYLTLPEGASAQHPAPMVVLAHGGPWTRDTPTFNPEVQFLASRGYAVLQPNYRGSIGYAPEISRGHEFDFRRMHDDVTDATKAMAGTGLIDAKRVAIMGGSFGGYLALAGVAFEDGLYRCAISECGVFDWESLIRAKRWEGRPGEYEMLLDELGQPGRDRERLEQISPLAHADQIRVPVLLAHGNEDDIVEVAQSKKLARALKQRGVPCETFFREIEGHGFFNYRNRVEFYHRVEAFLAANLGGLSLTAAK